MPSRPTGDPLLKRADWRAAVAYWRSQRDPCARCGGHIDRGSKTRGPDSLDVGHVVSRYEARRMGWTDEQINALTNTQPEHAHCGRSHGARLGNANRREAAGQARTPLTSESW
jgi:hypothetical protein